jgi:hypothetical protein
MEPRKDESKKVPEAGKEAGKRRFQIEKLEERIAPRRGRYHYHGPCYHGRHRGNPHCGYHY